MVEKPTVLILGAGASMGYGFPSGYQLLKDIHKACLELTGNPMCQTAAHLGIQIPDLDALGKAIDRAPVMSIDAFLEKRPEFMKVGKFCIAYHLIPRENEGPLFNVGSRATSWYQRLFEAIQTPTFEELGKNRLSIITYNYDRSLEHYLNVSIQTLYNKQPSEVEAAFPIKIVHVHGQLGMYTTTPGQGRTYDSNPLSPYHAECAMNGIRVISEDVDVTKDAAFCSALRLTRDAERIVFLGFGYHPDNIMRLRLHKAALTATKMGTCMGMGRIAQANAVRQIKDLHLGNHQGQALDILKFLEIYDVLS